MPTSSSTATSSAVVLWEDDACYSQQSSLQASILHNSSIFTESSVGSTALRRKQRLRIIKISQIRMYSAYSAKNCDVIDLTTSHGLQVVAVLGSLIDTLMIRTIEPATRCDRGTGKDCAFCTSMDAAVNLLCWLRLAALDMSADASKRLSHARRLPVLYVADRSL